MGYVPRHKLSFVYFTAASLSEVFLLVYERIFGVTRSKAKV